jgi:hypothetical protein
MFAWGPFMDKNAKPQREIAAEETHDNRLAGPLHALDRPPRIRPTSATGR